MKTKKELEEKSVIRNFRTTAIDGKKLRRNKMTKTKKELREKILKNAFRKLAIAEFRYGRMPSVKHGVNISDIKRIMRSMVTQALKQQREEIGNKLRKKMKIDYGTLHGSGGNVRELVIDENEFNKILKND